MCTGILVRSALAAFMSSILIGYAICFILERRKKEFSIYERIGMGAKTVRKLFLLKHGVPGSIHCDVEKYTGGLLYAAFYLMGSCNCVIYSDSSEVV